MTATEELLLEETIHAPRGVVWGVISDYAHPHRYTGGICDTQLLSGRTAGVGACRACDLPAMLWMRQYTVEEVDAWHEGEGFSFAITHTSAPIEAGHATWSLADGPAGGTVLRVTMRYRPTMPLGWVMRASLRSAFSSQIGGVLRDIRDWLESGVRAAPRAPA